MAFRLVGSTDAGPSWAALQSAGFSLLEEEAANELSEMFYGFDLDQKEFIVVGGERSVRLTLCRMDRHRSPVVMDIGPVMHIDDLVATKVAALINRREVRDYVDVAAALLRYSLDQLLDLAHQHDPALDPNDIVEVGRYLDRLDDTRFDYYRLSPTQIEVLRSRLAGWPRQ